MSDFDWEATKKFYQAIKELVMKHKIAVITSVQAQRSTPADDRYLKLGDLVIIDYISEIRPPEKKEEE